MESAKSAISSFLGRGGEQQTDVDETVNPAVTTETIKPHVHEETTEAVDKEVHQDHYHTTVQPIEHKEVLPEEHTHNLAPQVEKSFDHSDLEQDKEKHAATLDQFQDARTVQETTQSTAAAQSVAGEHVHHHVHEVVQPVVHKETLQPEVVHTTIPIHEKHIAPSEHHGLSTLPVKTMDEFQKKGTDLTEKHHSHHEYEGHPRSYNPNFQEERKPVDIDPRAHDGTHDLEKTGHTPSRPSTSTGTDNTGTGVTDTTVSDTTRETSEMASETTPSKAEETKEPSNVKGESEEPSSKFDNDDSVQHASTMGEDPSLVQSAETKSGKLTGSGTDGSHSAVFGLTPDGHKFDDTKSSAGKSAIPSEEKSEEKDSGKAEEDTGSRGVGTGKVAEQMHDPQVAEKGHDGKASYGDSDNKPGAGS